jgi:polyisoprenoid-binding protein YceI
MEYLSTFAATNNQFLHPLMKSIVLSTAALAALLLVACGPSEAEMAAKKAQAEADSLAAIASMEHSYMVDPAASQCNWKGVMLGVKEHNGTIKLTEGKLAVKGGMVTGGTFTVDMTSLTALDTNYAPDNAKKGTRAMLLGHLASPDFFDVATYPTATFVVTAAEGNTLTGELTVRGKTNTEKVTDVVITEENGKVMASGKLVFDRQKYGVAFSTGAKDMVINDNVELDLNLTGNEAK